MNKTDIVNDIKEIIEHSYLSKDEIHTPKGAVE